MFCYSKRRFEITGILIGILLIIILSVFSAEAKDYLIGDANSDGRINIRDVTCIQRELAQMNHSQSDVFNEQAADIDNNGLNISDATNIQRYLAEMGNPFKLGESVREGSQPRWFYYSSLSLAITDANNLTTAHHDLEAVDGAEAVVGIVDDTVYIRLVKDSMDTPALVINSKVDIDLNDNTLSFAEGDGITSSSDLKISNGTILGTIKDSLFCHTASNSLLSLDNLTINAVLDGDTEADETFVICSSENTVSLSGTTINAKIINDSETCTYSILSTESEESLSDVLINNSHFNVNSDEIIEGSVYVIKSNGNTSFVKSTICVDLSVNSVSTKRVYGLFCGGDAVVNCSNIDLNILSYGNEKRIVTAIANPDSSGNAHTALKNAEINIHYNTYNVGSDVVNGVIVPYGGELTIDSCNIFINSIADGKNIQATKLFAGIRAYGSDSLSVIAHNNNIRMNCHLTEESTESLFKVHQRGYDIDSCDFSSTSDVINCTTDTIYNNVIRSQALLISKSKQTNLDNIYAFVTSQPSYVFGSDGATSGINLKSSTVTITDTHGDNYVHGSHSGITASGNNMHLTVHGGTYESPAHGGFYFCGRGNSSFSVDGVKSLNTQNFNESFPKWLIQKLGAFYVCDYGCAASINNSYIYGGNWGLRVRLSVSLDENEKDTNTVHYTDVNIDNTYIYGDCNGINDDLYPCTGILTLGENTTVVSGGLDPDCPQDIWAWRGADIIDYRKGTNTNDLSTCEREDIVYNIENEYVQSFLTNPAYDSSDYSYTNFNPDTPIPELTQPTEPIESDNSETSENEEPVVRYDKPAGAVIEVPEGSARITFTDKATGKWWSGRTIGNVYTIANLIPGHKYDYVVRDTKNKAVKYGTVTAQGTIRMIDGGGTTFNIRDIGGWQADGGRLKYGMLYRGCELNGDTFKVFMDVYHKKYFEYVLGVKSEIDLRSYSEINGVDGSAISDNVEYNHYIIPAYAVGLDLQDKKYNYTGEYRDVLKKIAHNIDEGKPTYCHCLVGADRTGTVMYLIEALCGVSQSDIDKDYELTSFSGETRLRTNERYQTLVSLINKMKGNTLQEKAVSYALKIGVTVEEINMLRNGLIEGNPTEIIDASAWSDNLFDESNTSFDCYINDSGEVADGEAGQFVTDYIPVTQNTVIDLKSDISQNTTPSTGMLALYDSNKNYIAQVAADNSVWTWNIDKSEGSCPVWKVLGWMEPSQVSDSYYVKLCISYSKCDELGIKSKQI